MDPALIRPGRVDFKEYIGHCSESQLKSMFLRFYKGANAEEHAEQFATLVTATGKPVSPAQIQGFFMFHKQHDELDVVKNVDKIWALN